MTINKEASRIWRGRIRDILNRQRDPIGGCPADEYDGYAGKIAAIVRDNTTDEALMKYLEWAESVHMGLGRFDPDRARTVIASIRALDTAAVADAKSALLRSADDQSDFRYSQKP